jgi:hypothetical protein
MPSPKNKFAGLAAVTKPAADYVLPDERSAVQPAPEPPPVAIVPEAVAAPAATAPKERRAKPAPRAEGAAYVPPSRADKVAYNVHLTKQRRAAMKSYAALNGTTMDALMAEALDDLVKKRRIPGA